MASEVTSAVEQLQQQKENLTDDAKLKNGATVAAETVINASAVPIVKPNVTIVGQKSQDSGVVTRDDFDGGPVSLDEIEPGLFLGNLTAATHMETLKAFKISHILTLDTVPLPQHIIESSFLTTKYVQIADMPREDILHHLEQCVDFIGEALAHDCNVLVHCYFGVSRSTSAVIAYIMKRHRLDYHTAYDLVRSKRRFVQPNAGFVAQLKLYRRMGCKIEPNYQKYKLYRLRLAGEQMRKAKILPQSFHNLIKPDPGVTQANPDPIVYRCRKCRRVLASKSYVLAHMPRGLPPALMAAVPTIATANSRRSSTSGTQTAQSTGPRLLEHIAAQIRKVSLAEVTAAATTANVTDAHAESTSDTAANSCRSILFVEPIAWMQHITHNTQGRLNCPKCEQKLGNFSWINGCQCPCGETMTPAFYLIPSKVELSKTVQNVQTTV